MPGLEPKCGYPVPAVSSWCHQADGEKGSRCRHVPAGAMKTPRVGTVRFAVSPEPSRVLPKPDVKSDVGPKSAATRTTRQGVPWGSRPLTSRVPVQHRLAKKPLPDEPRAMSGLELLPALSRNPPDAKSQQSRQAAGLAETPRLLQRIASQSRRSGCRLLRPGKRGTRLVSRSRARK